MAKTKKKNNKSVIGSSLFSSSTLTKVFNNYKKNKEQKKLKEIKLKKFQKIIKF